MVQFSFIMLPWRPHRAALKERFNYTLLIRHLPGFAPFRAVLDNPVG